MQQQQRYDANLNCVDIMVKAEEKEEADEEKNGCNSKNERDPKINVNSDNNRLGLYESNASTFGKMRAKTMKTRLKDNDDDDEDDSDKPMKINRGRRKNNVHDHRRNRGEKVRRHLNSIRCDVIDRRSLFDCPSCGDLLRVPVTIDCGHTYCANCIVTLEKCRECRCDVATKNYSTNVLLQDIVDKCRESRRDLQQIDNRHEGANNRLGTVPRYYLRSSTHAACDNKTHCDKPLSNNKIDRSVRRNKRRRHLNPYCTERCEDYYNIKKRRVCDTSPANAATTAESVGDRSCYLKITDFDCILCGQYFLDPVTTGCGHTFCRDCLTRVLDHGLACPLCMAALPASDSVRGTTHVLQRALRIVAPHEYVERLTSSTREIFQLLDNDHELPVFVCTNAFPGVACPLYVYEPRYRLLARRCLQSRSRRFAMVSKIEGENAYATYGTILEVKDAVHLHDGRSILTTVGVRRFRIVERGEQDGYDTAKVQYIRDVAVAPDKLQDLIVLQKRVYNKAARWVNSLTPRVLDEVESTIGKMPDLEMDWPSLPDGPAWAWWLMPILPLCTRLQAGFLSTTNLEKRLRAIEKLLEHMKVRMKASKKSSLTTCTETVEAVDSCRYSGRSIDIPYANQ